MLNPQGVVHSSHSHHHHHHSPHHQSHDHQRKHHSHVSHGAHHVSNHDLEDILQQLSHENVLDLTDNKSLRLYTMLDHLSTQNLAMEEEDSDDGLFDNFKPKAKQPTKEEAEKDKQLSMMEEAQKKFMVDLNIDVGSLAACSYSTKNAYFKLENIVGGDGDQQIDIQTMPNSGAGDSQVTLNFCEAKFANKLPQACKDIEDSYAYYESAGSCVGLKPNDDNINTYGDEIREDDFITGLELTYASTGQKCPSDSTKDLSLKVQVMCPSDKDSFGDKLEFNSFEGDDCAIVMKYTSAKGCPAFSYDNLHIFLEKYSQFWGAALIIVGIFLAFFGNKFVNAVLFMAGMLFTWAAGVLVTFYILQKADKETSTVVNWVIIGVFGLLSIPVGYLVMKARKYGIAVLSVAGGVFLGLLLTSTLFISSKIAYWCIVIGCGIVVGLFALYTQKVVVMGSTAFIGSYAFVRGISMYVGEFPSEGSLQEMIDSGYLTWDNFPKTFFAYLAGIVVIFIASFYYQYKHNKKDKKEY